MINTAGVYTAAPTLEPVSAVTHAAPCGAWNNIHVISHECSGAVAVFEVPYVVWLKKKRKEMNSILHSGHS